MKKILINSSYGDELRVALVDGAKLYDFDTESPERTLLKGSIYKATVSRIESSLDAAFVNFGSDRHGFLPLKDLSKEFYKKEFRDQLNQMMESIFLRPVPLWRSNWATGDSGACLLYSFSKRIET